MFNITKFDFDNKAPKKISKLNIDNKKVGENWPIVYVINNNEEAYVGETVSAYRRADQHLQNKDRQRLTEIRIISDDGFNKSVVLDLESFLIRHMSSDGRYRLQNGNAGLQNHDYYDKQKYEKEFREIWNSLLKEGIVNRTIDEIENSELYKYSPYKSLGAEQRDAEMEIVKALSKYKRKDRRTTILVRGGAGTGKTILAIYLIKLFVDVELNTDWEFDSEEYSDETAEAIYVAENITGIDKIGLVVPQKSLKTSLREVFNTVNGLDESMVISPTEVVDDYIKTGKKYDLLLVDEAHRLKCRNKGHLSQYPKFDECNRLLGLDKYMGTELDWILRCSENQILFRDELQTVRPCDIDAERFTEILEEDQYAALITKSLTRQWRCLGGNDYVDYINDILSCKQVKRRSFEDYDVKIYRNIDKMVNSIKAKDAEMGLCRMVAGYAWQWFTDKRKRKKHPEWPNFDIKIQGHEYCWNSTYDNWIGKKNSINEIGCIHTVQGYDLNYAGVIIGKDIKYDIASKTIKSDKTNYWDQQGKSGIADNPELLREYLINIYLTLLTRGIKGTCIYICDNALQEYMEQFLDVED